MYPLSRRLSRPRQQAVRNLEVDMRYNIAMIAVTMMSNLMNHFRLSVVYCQKSL